MAREGYRSPGSQESARAELPRSTKVDEHSEAEQRLLEALEDDEVRESLRRLRAGTNIPSQGKLA